MGTWKETLWDEYGQTQPRHCFLSLQTSLKVKVQQSSPWHDSNGGLKQGHEPAMSLQDDPNGLTQLSLSPNWSEFQRSIRPFKTKRLNWLRKRAWSSRLISKLQEILERLCETKVFPGDSNSNEILLAGLYFYIGWGTEILAMFQNKSTHCTAMVAMSSGLWPEAQPTGRQAENRRAFWGNYLGRYSQVLTERNSTFH